MELIYLNSNNGVCYLRNCINGKKNDRLELFVGEDDSCKDYVIDLNKNSSVMVTGLNNDEIINLINSMIVSLIMKQTPNELELLLINNGGLDFSEFNGIPHLIRPLITDDNESLGALKDIVSELENRKRLILDSSASDNYGYNEIFKEKMKKIVIFINDIDYMVYKGNEKYLNYIQEIIRYGKEYGIYLICSSNYIDDDESDDLIVICNSIIAFRHSGNNIFNKYKNTPIHNCAFIYHKDMLDYDLIRIAPSFVSEEFINKVVDYWKGF